MNQDNESSYTGSSDKENLSAELSESDGKEADNLDLSDADAVTVADDRRFIALTIAKDRAKLAPQTANELIFLHDAVPALKRFEES
jgi:hypothetical protein